MGLPEIIIEFKTKGVTAIKRSARGIVAIVLKDDTEEGQALNIYKSVLDVDPTHFTARNYEYLKLVYEGSPAKTIVLKVATTEENLNPQLKQLNDLKWNYLVIPGITDDEKTTVAAWIKEARDDHHKTFKAVLPNCKGDHEGIINLTTDNITSTLGTAAFSTAEYCCRIAGVLAGLSLARSCSYFELTDITAADVPEDANERIDNGELVIVFDGEKYKIGRGVNSLTSFTPEHGQDFSKIKIIEGVDLYQDDIRETFESSYVGKVINDYDNKQALVAAILAYHRELEGNVLDRTFDNTAAIDVEAQETYLQSQGTDTSEMDETALAQANTGSKVFITSNVKFVDAMEDLMLREYLSCRKGGEALFASTRKPYAAMSPRAVEKALQRIGERAGETRRIYPHLMRHTFATNALHGGMDITTIQHLLGHSDPKTTLIYAELRPDAIRYAYEKVIA